MSRIASVFFALLAVSAGVTSASAMTTQKSSAPARSSVRHAHKKTRPHRPRHHRPIHGTRLQATVASDPALFGDAAIEPTLDGNVAGMPEAFPSANSATGAASSIAVYVDSHNQATQLIAGIYSDSNGRPGSLLVSGSLSSPKAGAWNTVTIPSTEIQSGTYWLAVLGRGGTFYFRDRGNGPCMSQNAASGSLSALTSAWAKGSTWKTCPLSAYVNGTLAATPTTTTPTSTTPTPTTTTTTTTPTTTPPPAPIVLPPVNNTAPTISGSPVEGNVLTASAGSWSDSPTSYAYQWQDCPTGSLGLVCTNIAGATSTAYTLTRADVGQAVRVLVTAANSAGSTAANSAQTSAVTVPPAPSGTGLPVISGSAVQGQALSTTNGTWTNNPTGYSYAWQDCDSSGNNCTAISGATSSSYVLGSGDVGHTIRARVTATNDGGPGSATSAQTAVVSAPTPGNSGLPVISGSTVQGQTLSTTNGSWSNAPTSYSYAWQDCDSSGNNCSAIANAAASTYLLASTDVGHTIRVMVTAHNGYGQGQATSASVGPVTAQQSGSCVGSANTPGGADPWGGCWPGPQNTGVPAGTTLTNVPSQISSGTGWRWNSGGWIDVTACGAVLNGLHVAGSVVVDSGVTNGTNLSSPCVTLENSQVDNDVRVDINGSGPLLLKSDYIDAPGSAESFSPVGTGNYEADNVNVVGGRLGFSCQENCNVNNSWAHAGWLACSTDGQTLPCTTQFHYNAWGGNGNVGTAQLVAHHDTFSCDFTNIGSSYATAAHAYGSGCSGDYGQHADNSSVGPIWLDESLIVAPTVSDSTYIPQYCYDVTPKTAFPSWAHVWVTNNVFQKGQTGQCGQSGPVYGWQNSTDDTWSGNVWDDGTPVSP